MSFSSALQFGKIRSLLWPIHRHEISRFLPMFIIYALIVFNYNLLKTFKDTLVITGENSGAEAIPFIKVWAMLPMALAFTFLFTKLSNKMTKERVFYTMMTIFISFFLLFGLVLYPIQHLIHPHALANIIESHLPSGFHGLITIFRNWSLTLFYVMSELWGTTIMSVLFWGFANEITSVENARRHYAIIGLGANLATILSGNIPSFINIHHLPFHPFFETDEWGKSLLTISLLVCAVGVVVMLLYRLLHLRLISTHGALPKIERGTSEIKMSMRKNFSYLANSKYLSCIAVIVLTYNIALNLVEVVWKQYAYELYPNPVDFSNYMGQVNQWIGIASTCFAVFFCGQAIRKWGWTKSALITPVALAVSTFLFFLFLLSRGSASGDFITQVIGMSPLAIGVFFGSIQNVLSRACKFTFFDTTKEIAFIPLSSECKLKGKAAIDGVGSRLGKSGGSVVHQFLLIFFGSIYTSTPYVAMILFFVLIAWIAATRILGKEFDAITAKGSKPAGEEIKVNETKSVQDPLAEPVKA